MGFLILGAYAVILIVFIYLNNKEKETVIIPEKETVIIPEVTSNIEQPIGDLFTRLYGRK